MLSLRPVYRAHAYPVKYSEYVIKYAKENAFSPALVFAIIHTESSFRPAVVSGKGAVGLMQLLPQTAQFVAQRNGYDYLDVYLTDAEYNVRLGCRYLSYLRTRFMDESTLLAAYNAGEGTVATWLKNPKYSKDGSTLTQIPYRETKNYVVKVQNVKNKYKKHYSFS